MSDHMRMVSKRAEQLDGKLLIANSLIVNVRLQTEHRINLTNCCSVSGLPPTFQVEKNSTH